MAKYGFVARVLFPDVPGQGSFSLVDKNGDEGITIGEVSVARNVTHHSGVEIIPTNDRQSVIVSFFGFEPGEYPPIMQQVFPSCSAFLKTLRHHAR